MEKRTLLAIILSILVLVAFSYLSPQRKPVQRQIEPQEEGKQIADSTLREKIKEEKLPPYEAIPATVPSIPLEEKEIKVETNLYSAVFTTRGGTIKKWGLKKYTDNKKRPVSLISPDAAIPPISIILGDQLRDLPSKVNYSVDRDSIILDSTTDRDTLTFSYADTSGLSIKKIFTFNRDNYGVNLSIDIEGVQSYYVVLGSEFGVFDEKGAWVHIGPVLLKDTDKIDIKIGNIEGINFFQRFAGRKSKSEMIYQGNIHWIAQEDKYFAAALASMSKPNDVKVWERGKSGNSKNQGVEIAYNVNGERGEFLLYAGPKQYELLKPFGVGLEHIIDFGFFSIIARPLFWLLKLFYKVIGNYGWAIVLLTIIVRIPFIPLLNKSQKSMKKLQEIQPHMAAIREKHKKDPQKMQKEMMELYKKHKVNPMGGCLPMLTQLPVFLALYKILLIAIELRGAPFVWWIADLSVKDPYYVFPVLMGVTMVIQQKITPTAMDPKQAKIMMLMPIFFTFLFLSFPVGLVLYWLVNNTLGIIQQYFINKKAKSSAA
jgi:YidC/Oxa1 family membrane protein insertase